MSSLHSGLTKVDSDLVLLSKRYGDPKSPAVWLV